MNEASDTEAPNKSSIKPIRSKDLTGLVFGEYLVVEFAGNNQHNTQMWKCLCKCGSERILQKPNLLFSKHPSCGCVRRSKIRNLSSERFGNFIVLKFSHQDKNGHRHWLCKCDCGTIKSVDGPALVAGHTKSCGKCIPRSGPLKHANAKRLQVTPEYKTWLSMKARTTNPSSKSYAKYGAVGIKTCERWFNSFENFLADMGRKPTLTHSLDRIDNSKGYSPENCRWATPSQQARNRRTNVILDLHGLKKTVKEWSEITGIQPSTIHARLKMGWSINKTLSQKVRQINFQK